MQRREALLTMAALAAGLGGCSRSGSKKRRIAVIPKGTSHDFWKSVHYGADKAAKEFDVDIEWNGTSDETDKVGQRKIMETFIGNKLDGICLAPIDRKLFVRIVETARQQEIPTVVFDSGLADHKDVVSYVATDNKKGGLMAGEYLAKVMGEKGGVIMLRYQANSESTEQREAGFLEAIKKYPGIKILSENQRVNSNTTEALKISESLLRDNKKQGLTGVFTVCEPNNKGMLTALKNEKLNGEPLAGKIKFVGFDSDPRVVEGLKEGTVNGVVLQDPVNMGYLAVKTMVQHLDGKKPQARIDTGVYLATKDNMSEKKFQELLSPRQYGG